MTHTKGPPHYRHIPLQGARNSGAWSLQTASVADGRREASLYRQLLHSWHPLHIHLLSLRWHRSNPGASAQCLKLGRCCAVNLSLCGWQPGVNDWDTGSRNRSVRCLAPVGSHVLAEDGTGINKQPIPAHRRNRSQSPKQKQERLEVVCVTSYRGRWIKPLPSLKLSSCVRSQKTG